MIPDRRNLDDSRTFFQPIWRGKSELGENKVRKKNNKSEFFKRSYLHLYETGAQWAMVNITNHQQNYHSEIIHPMEGRLIQDEAPFQQPWLCSSLGDEVWTPLPALWGESTSLAIKLWFVTFTSSAICLLNFSNSTHPGLLQCLLLQPEELLYLRFAALVRGEKKNPSHSFQPLR